MLVLLPATSHQSGVLKQKDPEAQHFIPPLKIQDIVVFCSYVEEGIYLNTSSCNVRKVVVISGYEDVWRSGGMTSHIRNIGTTWR
jgi:hypothetical protein